MQTKMNLKQMLEFAGVDTSKGKAKILVEAPPGMNLGMQQPQAMQGQATNQTDHDDVNQDINKSDEDLDQELTQIYNNVKSGQLTPQQFIEAINNFVQDNIN